MDALFLCARLTPEPDTRQRIRALVGGSLDWDVLIDVAREHRVLPMVYRTLSGLEAGSVPEDVLSRLRGEYRAIAARNLMLTAELLRVIDVLSQEGISVLTYKGPVLATSLYGDVSLRQFGDLDLIVRQDDVWRVRTLLEQRGYRLAFEITGKDVSLVHEQLGVPLELHWGITSKRHSVQIDPGQLWRNLRTVSLGGRSVVMHAPEDLLWILCVHGGHHRWERLGWVCDVVEVVRGSALDWDRVVGRATELGVRRMLLLGLLLAKDCSGAKLPPRVRRRIEADRSVMALATEVKGWMATPGIAPSQPGDVERYLIKLGDGVEDRLRIAVRQAGLYLAPQERDAEMVPMPRHLGWLLYVLRPIRLAWSYGLAPIRRFVEGIFGL